MNEQDPIVLHNSLQTIVRRLLDRIVPDSDREGLRETPSRVAKAWSEWTEGYYQDPGEVLKTFEDGAENYNQIVFVGNIPFASHCEHHLAPFFGEAAIGYIPDKKIIGLSKMPRLLDVFAHRLQVQERITRQVADAIEEYLKPKAVGVVLTARHLCMESRGIKKIGAFTTTSAVRGLFLEEPTAKAEFLSFVQMSQHRSRI